MKLGIHQTGKVGIDSHFALSSSFLILYWHLLFALSSHQKERAQWDTSFLLFVAKSSSAGVGVFERRYHFYRRHLLGLFSNNHLDLLFDRCRSAFQNSRHSVALPCPVRTLSLSLWRAYLWLPPSGCFWRDENFWKLFTHSSSGQMESVSSSVSLLPSAEATVPAVHSTSWRRLGVRSEKERSEMATSLVV